MTKSCERTELLPASSADRKGVADPRPLKPFASIVLCTNGLRSTLIRCLEQLASQDYPSYEIIVVLNGPEDAAFAQAVSRFPVRLLNEPRRGVSIARNHAVSKAKGEILVFVDDDVLIGPDWLHEIISGFNDPTVACVTGRVIPAGPVCLAAERAERYYASERALSAWTLDASDPNWYQYILGKPVGFGCNMAFRKAFLENYALFPVDLGAGSLIGGGDEFYMYVQALKHGFRIRHTPTAVATHYFENDISKQKVRDAQLRAGSAAFAIKLFLEEKTLRPATLRWLLSGLRRRALHVWEQRAIASEPQELLSPGEKLRAYVRGLGIYWKSRRTNSSATLHS